MRDVHGETDSERFFALITREIDAAAGDVGEGITRRRALGRRHLPIYALNVVLITPTDLWALRYPDTHDLLVLGARAGIGRPPFGHRPRPRASSNRASSWRPRR